ncbi:hypothetical protein D5086_006842 [Populus alba]|uniref:Uncharacterized protein n=1 Tax=Populus alba TaxID=43335 RepID=A0ACC4CLT8_POPAL
MEGMGDTSFEADHRMDLSGFILMPDPYSRKKCMETCWIKNVMMKIRNTSRQKELRYFEMSRDTDIWFIERHPRLYMSMWLFTNEACSFKLHGPTSNLSPSEMLGQSTLDIYDDQIWIIGIFPFSKKLKDHWEAEFGFWSYEGWIYYLRPLLLSFISPPSIHQLIYLPVWQQQSDNLGREIQRRKTATRCKRNPGRVWRDEVDSASFELLLSSLFRSLSVCCVTEMM